MEVRHLLHLLSVSHENLEDLPASVPKGYGTVQVYSLVFDALLNGHCIGISVRWNNVWAIGDDDHHVGVPFSGAPSIELIRELIASDPMFADLFESGETEDGDVISLRFKSLSPLTKEQLQAAGCQIDEKSASMLDGLAAVEIEVISQLAG